MKCKIISNKERQEVVGIPHNGRSSELVFSASKTNKYNNEKTMPRVSSSANKIKN